MKLLRLISWPYARKHRLRWLLTIFGILLGVSIFVGMHAAGGAVLSSLNDTVDRIAGKTQLQITAGEAGFPEQVLERVQSMEAVAAAVPALEAVVQTGIAGEGNLLVLAVDMTGDRSLRDYDLDSGDQDIVEDPLIFLAQPDSLIVTDEFAKRNGFAVNSKLSMQTMDGAKDFTIRGMMRSGGVGAAFGGNLAVMDIYAAQKVFGRGERFDRIDVRLKETVTLEQGQAALQQALGPGFEVETPAARSRQFESLLQIYSLTVDITSLFALFIGMFIIYNTLSIAVTERQTEIGILRSLGATQKQIITLFLLESATAGLIGSCLGVIAGLGIARVVSGYVGNIMTALYGVAVNPGNIAADQTLVSGAVVMGIAISVVAAIIPARHATRIDPVKALQKGQRQAISSGQNRARRRSAALFGAIAIGCVAFGRSQSLFFPGYLSFLVAVFLLVPTLSLWLSRGLRPVLKRISPVEGVLAADSLVQAPRRTSPTVAALMFSAGLIVSLGGISRSSYESVAEWVDTSLSPQLFVSASENLVDRSFHFPDSTTAELAAVPGVEEVQRMRTIKVRVGNASVLLVATDVQKLANRTRGRTILAGTFDEMHRLAAEGRGVIVSETFSLLHGTGLNDVIEIPSPAGIIRLPIAGVVRDYTYQAGAILMDYSVYLQQWKDPSVDIYQVYLQPGADAAGVKQRILQRLGSNQRLFVFMSAEVKSRIMENTNQWLALIYVQIVIAVLVAILGIASTLSVSIVNRRREFAVLRAVGGLPFQVRRSVWLEAVAIAVIGVALGLAFGALDLSFELELVRRYYAGMTLDYRFPIALALVLVPVFVAAGLLSALIPAESAVRGALVEGLENE